MQAVGRYAEEYGSPENFQHWEEGIAGSKALLERFGRVNGQLLPLETLKNARYQGLALTTGAL